MMTRTPAAAALRAAALACVLTTQAAFGALMLPGAAPLCAQGAPGADRIPARLSLEDALRLARTHSPLFLQTSNDVMVADANVKSAYGRFMPSLSTSMGVSGSETHTVTYLDPITQRPERLEDPQTSSGSGLSQGLSMGVTLFDGGAMFKNLALQKATARATESNIVIQQNALNASVRQSFYQALRAVQSIALSERLLASAQDRLVQTEALFRTAAKGTVDVLGAKEDIATYQMALETARNDATKARLALAQVIGIPSDGSFELVGTTPEVYDPARLSVDSLVALARRSNPTLQRQELMVGIAEKQLSSAKASRWPSLSASFNFSRSVSVPDFTAYRYLNPQNNSKSLSIGASLPLFSRFTTSAAIAGSRANAQDSRYQLAQTSLQIETDVRSAYIDFTTAYHSLELADLKAQLSNERLALSQEAYQRGSITFSALQQIIDRAASSERDALNARFTWLTNLVALEIRVGAPIVK